MTENGRAKVQAAFSVARNTINNADGFIRRTRFADRIMSKSLTLKIKTYKKTQGICIICRKMIEKQPAHQTTHQHTFTSQRRTTMIFAIAAALLTAVLLYMLLFEDWDDFLECVKFWLIPDIISMFRGKYWEDAWAELKLLLWLGISIGVGALVYHNFG